MALFSLIQQSLRRHSLVVNIAINIFLLALCFISFVLLFVLFLTPRLLWINSLVYVENSKVSPTVVIGLIGAVFSTALSALLTRAVEHSFWLKLTHNAARKQMTVAECHRLAQWSVSSLGRFNYVFTGQSWSLRFGGLLLFTLAMIDPALLSGVTPHASTTTTEETRPRSAPQFAGFLDRSNSEYNGGQFRDNLMNVAALAQLTGLSAPPSKICTNVSCHVEARVASIRAQCRSYQFPNPEQVGFQSSLSYAKADFCSEFDPDLCVTLVKSDPRTYANFTTGYPGGCNTSGQRCPGYWGTILGAWVDAVDLAYNATRPINTVDCSLTFGNVTVVENGGSSPFIEASSFTISSLNYDELPAEVEAWRRIYTEQPNTYSPYSFSGVAGGASGANTLYENILGLLLLNYADANGATASEVAAQIESNFEYGTLFAYSRKPHTAELKIMTETSINMWHYDPKMLAILILPFLATLLVVWRRWNVGDDETVVGYLPVEIARKGPVEPEKAMPGSPRRHETNLDREERTLVWSGAVNELGKPHFLTRLFD